MHILLTGASGFVGRAVLNTAQQRGLNVRPVYRTLASADLYPTAAVVAELNVSTNWGQALQGIDVVVHAAGRSHIMRGETSDSLAEYRRVNVQGTLNLARQAAAAGVRRFIFLSSIKVNGESTIPGRPFHADDDPAPEDEYARSKAEAEAQLRRLAQSTSMEVTIIRPTLIYGHGVKGNFATLIRLVSLGVPLPLAGVTHNRRSLVGLDNLVDLILVCSTHPRAANQTFLVSDGIDLSTAVLLKTLGNALNRRTRLLWFPNWLILLMARILGREIYAKRLIGSLQVDMEKTRRLLGWDPLVSVDDGFRRAVE